MPTNLTHWAFNFRLLQFERIILSICDALNAGFYLMTLWGTYIIYISRKSCKLHVFNNFFRPLNFFFFLISEITEPLACFSVLFFHVPLHFYWSEYIFCILRVILTILIKKKKHNWQFKVKTKFIKWLSLYVDSNQGKALLYNTRLYAFIFTKYIEIKINKC